MSTRQRAWLVRAGVIGVVATAGLLATATPAWAEGAPSITGESLTSNTINGDNPPEILQFDITNDDGSVSIKVTTSVEGVTLQRQGGSPCGQQCSFTGGTGTYKILVSAVNVTPGEERSGTIDINADEPNNCPSTPCSPARLSAEPKSLAITAQGPTPLASVPEVSGVVVNVFTNDPIAAARVFLQDSATPAHNYEVGTDKDGKFKFISTAQDPIAPGTLAFRVEKDLFQTYDKTQSANPGQPLLNVRLTVSPIAASGTPSSIVSGSGSATVPSLDDTENVSPNEQEGGLSWVLIGMGALLVVLGLSAIGMLLFRKGEDGPRGRRGPGGRPRRGGPRGPGRGGPGGRGGPRRRGRTPVSPGPRNDTAISRSPLADSPTHPYSPARPANPYGGGYGPNQTYGGQPTYGGGGGYGTGSGYGQPPADPYATSGGGYR